MFFAGRPRAMRPRIRAPPMFPPPTNAALMFMKALSRSRLAIARPEDGRADTHDGRPFGDRRFEIGTGAHRQGVETEALLIERIEYRAGFAKPLALARRC